MATITVLRPDQEAAPAGSVVYAERTPIEAGAVLTLIENGKPRARDLMQFVAEELKKRLPIAEIDLHSKPSAAKPIEPEEARKIAARSRLVITGVGD
jgi:hypothetical protein